MQELAVILESSAWFGQILDAAAAVQMPECWVGAGVVRDVVWDTRYGNGFDPGRVKDVDVAYFDPADLTAEKESAVEGQLAAALPGVPWQAKNQAAVHLWYGERFGVPVPPLASLNEAVGTWPEYATAVAVRRGRSHSIEVIAPIGLDDLLDGIWRWNPRRASFEEALRRLRSKSVPSRWPGVIVDEELRAGLSKAPIGG